MCTVFRTSDQLIFLPDGLVLVVYKIAGGVRTKHGGISNPTTTVSIGSMSINMLE
jgi:hypothetical protein